MTAVTICEQDLLAPYVRRRGLRAASRRGEHGQALVEFALVVPVMMICVLGIIDFGRAFNYKNNVTNMANQAARYVEVNTCAPCSATQSIDGAPGSPNTTSYIVDNISDSTELKQGSGGTFGITSPAAVSVCFPSGGTPGQLGNAVRVTVSATYRWLPFLSLGTTTLTSSVTTRIANQWVSGAPANEYLQGGPVTCPS
jgi:hypothetical protein